MHCKLFEDNTGAALLATVPRLRHVLLGRNHCAKITVFTPTIPANRYPNKLLREQYNNIKTKTIKLPPLQDNEEDGSIPDSHSPSFVTIKQNKNVIQTKSLISQK